MNENRDLHSSKEWSFFANAAAAGANSFGRPTRNIRVGGDGVLYLFPLDSTSEKQFGAAIAAGEQFRVECQGIGPSTTCTNLTVQF